MKTYLKEIIILTWIFALAFAFAQVAGAQTILIDQQPDQVNGYMNDSNCDICGTGQQSVAENFFLAATETIGQIIIWGGYFPTNVPLAADNYTVIFHADAAGLPGAAVAPAETNVPTTRVDTGINLFGVDEYQFTLTLVNPVTLTPGIYWVEIYNDSTGSAESVFWETGSLDPLNGIDNDAASTSTPGSGAGWFNLGAGNNMSLQLITISPIPVHVPSMNAWGMIIFSLLLAGSALWAIRQRKSDI